MKKSRFLYPLICCLAAALCLLSACGAPAPFHPNDVGQESSSASTVSANDIATAVIKQTPIDNMAALGAESVSLYYDIDLSLLEDYAVYMSTINNSADEISIFHLKEGADSEEIIRALNTRIQMKMQTFQTLAPNEYEKLSHALLHTNGNYIALLVCQKADTAYSILMEHYHFPAMTNTGLKKNAILAGKGD